ncbi:MAG: hypothetical protein DRO98_06735 [Archaeoglobales archaeon]|nr:MAG: hypothetical protein DRO98_06735 [Archaeoglobales archaeon]
MRAEGGCVVEAYNHNVLSVIVTKVKRLEHYKRMNIQDAAVRFSFWILRTAASLAFLPLLLLLHSMLEGVDPTLYSLYLTSIVLCLSSGIQGMFLCSLVESLKTKKSVEASLVYIHCGHLEVVDYDFESENVARIRIRCRESLITPSGCPKGCPMYFKSRPTGAGTLFGMIGGGLIGLGGGAIGVILGGVLGGLVGTAIEDLAFQSQVARLVSRARSEGRRIIFEISE